MIPAARGEPPPHFSEAIMTTTHPTKEQVRAYMAERRVSQQPPQTPEEIRRQLGWGLMQQSTGGR